MARPLGVNIISTFDSKGISRAIADFKKLGAAGASSGTKATFALRTVDSAAKKMAGSVLKAGAGLAIIGGLAVKSFASFDDAMTQSTAIMGDLSDDMKGKMSAAARQMARTTTFSATEAAQSFYFLASAGLDATASMMALPKVAKFAQAGMFDMALATDLLTDAQSALGLTIRNDAVANMNNMVRVSDVLVKANTLANASVQQFSEALTNKAGAAMKAVGMDIEEGVAVLAAFADQGIKSEEAGTQFGIVLRDLQTKALKNTDAFKKYNVSVFDSSGEMRNMADIVGDLEGALDGKSDATKKATLLEMGFSDKSISSMLALMGTSEAIRGYEEQLRLAGGTTEEVAEKQLTSLSAQLKLAKNNLNDVAITIGSKLAPYVRALAGVFQGFGEIASEQGIGAGLKYLGGQFLDLTANMGTFGNVLLGLTTAFVTLRLVSIAAAISQTMFNVALLANPIGLTIAYFIAMGVILAGLYIKFAVVREAINMMGTALKFVFINTIAAVQNYFIFFINLAIMGINVLIKAANFFGADLEEVGLLGFKAFTGIGNAAETAGKKINYTSAIVDAESKRFGALAGKVKVYGSAVVKTFSGVRTTVETAKGKLAKFVDQLDKYKSATRSVRDANKSAIKSDQDLADAKTKLADAQAYLNQITAGYGKESKQAKTAQRKVTDAERSAERSKYAIEEATFAVSDAEQDLIDIRADSESSIQDVREAEIALAQAKLSLKDSIDSEVDATDQLTEANLLLDEAINGVKEGSDAYKEAQDAIVKAQDGVLDAIDSQTTAYERQKDAIDALAKATEILNKVKADVPLAVAKGIAAEAGVDLPPITTPTTTTPSGKVAGYGSFMDAVRALHPNSTSLNSKTPVTDSKKKFPKLFADYKAGNLVPLARGGIVTSPTAALIGESGAEAVIPLDKMNQGMIVNVTVNAGMGANPNEIGNEIVNVLQRYNRLNGALPLKVS
jgi:TP901 family phage tail tape measure protein